MAMDARSLVGEAFAPSEQLTTRIRNILGDYPAGVSSLKELLQNADDARARDFRVLYDPSSYAEAQILAPSLASLQRSPSILVFNDSRFSERDFQNILSLGDSAKRRDVGTVGKYGVGFNVVYHLADVVTFISGDHLVVFDPHGRHLPDQVAGRRYALADVRRVAPDVLAPFAAAAAMLGVAEDAQSAVMGEAPFPGTLLRLPLRDAAAASSSLLSSEALGEGQPGQARARALLTDFASQAQELLLFLQHVESVRVYATQAGREAETTTDCLGGAEVVGVEDCPELRAARAAVALQREELLASQAAAAAGERLAQVDEDDDWEHESEFYLRIRSLAGQGEVGWAVRGGLDLRLAGLAEALGQLAYIWVAVAMFGQQRSSGSAYCGLPLPTPTGLPFCMNGPFALSSNRRDLWVAGRLADADQQGGAGRLADWNRSLLHAAVPRLLIRLLLPMRPELQPQTLDLSLQPTDSAHCPNPPRFASAADLYEALPRPRSAAEGFSTVAEAVLRHVLTTNAPLFVEEVATDKDSVSTVQRWSGPRNVLFLPSDFERRVTAAGARDSLRRLRFAGHGGSLGCAQAPGDLALALVDLRSAEDQVAVLTKELLCRALQPLAPDRPATMSAQAAAIFSREAASQVLGWLIDAEDEFGSGRPAIESAAQRLLQLLDGVPIVPLAPTVEGACHLGVLRYSKEEPDDATACAVTAAEPPPILYNPHLHVPVARMLPAFPRLLDQTACCAQTLVRLAGQVGKALNVQPVTPDQLAAGLMGYVLPPAWEGRSVLLGEPTGQEEEGGQGSHQAQETAETAARKGAMPAKPNNRSGGRQQGKKEQVKQRQLARKEQRAAKDEWAGLPQHSLAESSMPTQGKSGLAGTAASSSGRTQSPIIVTTAEMGAVTQRLAHFWRFLDEFPHWHDSDNLLDEWPLMAVSCGDLPSEDHPQTQVPQQLLRRKAALAKRVLRATDLLEGEEELLRRFGASTLHPQFRRSGKASRCGCAPRREALTAICRAQRTPNAAEPQTAEVKLQLRRWVRRFVQEGAAQEAEHREGDSPANDGPPSVDDAELDPIDVWLPLEQLLPFLPIFETLGRGELVAVMTSSGTRRVLGAPAAAPFAGTSPWEDLLQGREDWDRRLLSYSSTEACWVLKAAKLQRCPELDFLAMLKPELLSSLPQEGCLLYLQAVNRARPWRHAGSTEHGRIFQASKTARLIVWSDEDSLPHHPRCCASACADPEDSNMRRVLQALDEAEEANQTEHQLEREELRMPPLAYRQDPEVLGALRQLGLRCLTVHEAFCGLAARVEAAGSIEAGSTLAACLLQQPERLVREWPKYVWASLRRIAFLPCHDCKNGVPPAPESGEYRRLASRLHPQPSHAVSHTRRRDSQHRAADQAAAWEELEDDEEGGLVAARKDAVTVDLLQRATQLMLREPLGDEAGKLRLCAPGGDVADYADRWHCWEVCPFLPKPWAQAPDALRAALLPSIDTVKPARSHLKAVSQRIEQTHQELRGAWRGPLLWALTVLRDQSLRSETLPAQPLTVVLDGGETCSIRSLCLDLTRDLGAGVARVRAVPRYLHGLGSLFAKMGASTAAAGAPEIEITAPNLFEGPEAALSLLAGAVNDPTFADVVFHFSGDLEATDTCAYGHRLVLGRASEALRQMLVGPMAEAAQRADGRLHIQLPTFAEPAAFAFLLAHLYVGSTEEAAGVAGVVLRPVSFEGAQYVCSVMRLADHFLLPHLKQWCEAYLSEPDVLTVESVVDILTHADGCNAEQLFKVCVHQIGLLYETVQQTSAWQSLSEEMQERVAAEIRRSGRKEHRSRGMLQTQDDWVATR